MWRRFVDELKNIMGAWGTGIFDNDMACDWAGELDGAEDLSPVEEALEAGAAPRVLLQSTHERALRIVALDDLKRHAIDLS